MKLVSAVRRNIQIEFTPEEQDVLLHIAARINTPNMTGAHLEDLLRSAGATTKDHRSTGNVHVYRAGAI